MMLTSSEWSGLPTFVSKQHTQVCFCASDQSYIAFNVLYVVRHPLEKSFLSTPPYPSEITTFKPPSPLEFPMIFRGGGGGWIFSGATHYYLAGSETLKPRRAVLHIIMYCICSKRKMQKEKEGFGKFQVITGHQHPQQFQPMTKNKYLLTLKRCLCKKAKKCHKCFMRIQSNNSLKRKIL